MNKRCDISLQRIDYKLLIMKKHYLLLLGLLCSSNLFAQSRIISGYYANYQNGAFVISDTMSVIYKQGNTATGGVEDLDNGTLKFDELQIVEHDKSGTTLQLSYQELNDYDANGNLVKSTQLRSNPGSGTTLVNYRQYIYTYDANNNNTSELGLNWNDVTNTWDSSRRQTYTYDANGNMQTHASASYSTTAPVGFNTSTLRHYAYDANNNMVLQLTEVQIPTTIILDTSYRTRWFYSTNGGADSSFYDNFSRTTRTWSSNSKTVNTYSGGSLSESINYYRVGSQWTGVDHVLFTYNQQGEIIKTTNIRWDGINNLWKNSHMDTTLTIATNPLTKEYIRYSWVDSNATYTPLRKNREEFNADGYSTLRVSTSWDIQTQAWIYDNNTDSAVYRYEDMTPANASNLAANTTPEVTLYPNPANQGYINVHVANTSDYTVAIYNLQGTLVAQQRASNANGNKAVTVAHLPSGQYLLTVKTAEGQATRQFTIAK